MIESFLDTSVLVAAFYSDHEHYALSSTLLLRCQKESACAAAHSLVEVYSVLTRMPGKNRASSGEVLLFLKDLRERLAIVSLTEEEYVEALQNASNMGIMGGGIYDALLAYCAMKVKAETIYTWNVKHFNRLGKDVASRVRTPPV